MTNVFLCIGAQRCLRNLEQAVIRTSEFHQLRLAHPGVLCCQLLRSRCHGRYRTKKFGISTSLDNSEATAGVRLRSPWATCAQHDKCFCSGCIEWRMLGLLFRADLSFPTQAELGWGTHAVVANRRRAKADPSLTTPKLCPKEHKSLFGDPMKTTLGPRALRMTDAFRKADIEGFDTLCSGEMRNGCE